MIDYHNIGCCNWRLEKRFQHKLCLHRKVLDSYRTWRYVMASWQKLTSSPGSRLGASSTCLAAGSVVRPRAPTTIDHLKFRLRNFCMHWLQILKFEGEGIMYHNTGCCSCCLLMSFQHRLCHRRKVMDSCKTWWTLNEIRLSERYKGKS